MSKRDLFGISLIGFAVAILTLYCKLHNVNEVHSVVALGLAFICAVLGVNLIYTSYRDRRLREALEATGGDFGDAHYTSGSSFTDDGGDDY